MDFPLEMRAWIEKDKMMFYQHDQYLISFLRRSLLFHSGGDNQHPSYGEPPYMFYIGQLDKNKKKIFTEDYVVIRYGGENDGRQFRTSYSDLELEKPHKVFWNGFNFGIAVDEINAIPLQSYLESDVYEVEVVGNVFENPDGFICSECQFEEARHSLECSKK